MGPRHEEVPSFHRMLFSSGKRWFSSRTWPVRFYSALPELALGTIVSSQKRPRSLTSYTSKGPLEELIRSADTVIKRQEVPACWRKMARTADFHKEPWFWVSGSRKQVHTLVGTRPGDTLADVVFALTFLAFQNSLEQFLGQVGTTIRAPRRCGGIFGTGEVVQEDFAMPDLHGRTWPL